MITDLTIAPIVINCQFIQFGSSQAPEIWRNCYTKKRDNNKNNNRDGRKIDKDRINKVLKDLVQRANEEENETRHLAIHGLGLLNVINRAL